VVAVATTAMESVVETTASGSNGGVQGYGSMACCPVATTIQGESSRPVISNEDGWFGL
jgi:hypothetical protein